MTNAQANMEIDIDSKIKEAEVYYSMGLLAESLGVYERPSRTSRNRTPLPGKKSGERLAY